MIAYKLDDFESAKSLLLRDKTNILEGIVAEQVFLEDMCNGQPVSLGWWTASYNYNYIIFKVSQFAPVNLDIIIFRELIKRGYPIYYAYYVKGQNGTNDDIKIWHVNAHLPTYLQNPKEYNWKDAMSLDEFVKLHNLKKIKEPTLATEDTRDRKAQERIIQYFHSRHSLTEIALQRYFANYFLSVYFYFPINIDGLTVVNINGTDRRLLVLEMKFKYPTYSKEYGLNKGFVNLFNNFLSKDIAVRHYVLNNPYGKETSIIDILDDSNKIKCCAWKRCDVEQSHLIGNSKTAPKETDFEGKKVVQYVGIPIINFRHVKMLYEQVFTL